MESIEFIIFPIIFAALAGSIIGFLWYAVFLKKGGQTEKETVKMKDGKPTKGPAEIFLTSFIANFFSAGAVYVIFRMLKIQNFAEGLRIMLLVWILFAFVSGMKKIALEKKSFQNLALGIGHDLVVLLSIASVLISFINW